MAGPKVKSSETTVVKSGDNKTVTITSHTEYEGGGFGGSNVRLPAPTTPTR
jgi:hypothetical protein